MELRYIYIFNFFLNCASQLFTILHQYIQFYLITTTTITTTTTVTTTKTTITTTSAAAAAENSLLRECRGLSVEAMFSLSGKVMGAEASINRYIQSHQFKHFQLFSLVVTKDQSADWKKDAVKDAIIDSVDSPFLWRHRVSKCMSWYSVLKSLWRKLQSRAIISLEEKFPFSESRSNFIKAKAYRTYLRADKARLKRQKRQVLSMAYKTEQPIFVAKLLKNLVFDLGFFQFSLQPGFLFDKNSVKETE